MIISTTGATRKALLCALALSSFFGLSQAAVATEFTGNAFSITATGAPEGASSLRLSGPDGFTARVDGMSYEVAEAMPDGAYSYEVVGALEGKPGKGVVDSGYFKIRGGQVVVETGLTD